MDGSSGFHPDPALLELFQSEMDTHIPVLSEGLLALERTGPDSADVAAMMRAAHSIKGAARIVGIEAAVRLAHIMEDCFLAAKEGRVALTGAGVDVLLQGVDALQRICSTQPDPELSDARLAALHDGIAALREGRTPEPGRPPAREAPPEVEGAAPPQAAATLLALPADIDDAAAVALRTQLCTALRGPAPRLLLDFSGVERLSAAALALLGSLAREAERSAASVQIVGETSQSIAAVMRVAGLDRAWTPSA